MLPETFTVNGKDLSRSDLASLVGIVQDDARGTSLQGRPVFLRILGGPDHDLSGVPEPALWAHNRVADESERYLLVIDDNVTDVTYGTPAQMLAEIASLVQDYVIDTTGSPWPLHSVGERTTVLEAAVIDSEVWWCDRGQPIYRIGELNNNR